VENIVIKIDNKKSRVSIDNIEFLSDADLTILRNYNGFVYNVTFYKGKNIVCNCQMNIVVTVIEPNRIRVMFDGFGNKPYNKAVILSITAYKNNEQLTIMLEHEITYTFHN